MKIAAGTLFLGLSVFLHSIELISSAPNPDFARQIGLKRLFPGSNGLHFPPLEKLSREEAHSFLKFLILNDHPMLKPVETYFKRGNVIVGWEDGENVGDLGRLYNPHERRVVFNTTNQQWYIIDNLIEFEKLGPNRCWTLVQAHDEAAAVEHSRYLNHARDHPANPQAHYAASKEAYMLTRYSGENLTNPVSTYADSIKRVKEKYHRSYNEEYQRQAGLPPAGGR